MGLDTSYNNIKDVLSPPTVSPHQACVTCMCNYHKITLQMGLDCRQTSGKDVFNVVITCVQSHLKCYFCDIYIITIIYLKSYIANKIKSDISRAFRGVVEMEGGAARL
jgi:hypothetical protein